MAALALSFSLQLQFPSPFYFFDEIDAALDTKTAQLVANYIKVGTSLCCGIYFFPYINYIKVGYVLVLNQALSCLRLT